MHVVGGRTCVRCCYATVAAASVRGAPCEGCEAALALCRRQRLPRLANSSYIGQKIAKPFLV